MRPEGYERRGLDEFEVGSDRPDGHRDRRQQLAGVEGRWLSEAVTLVLAKDVSG